MRQFWKLGMYGRNIESGWLGVIVEFCHDQGPRMVKMKGVNELYRTLTGKPIEECLDDDDVQWHDTADLKPVNILV